MVQLFSWSVSSRKYRSKFIGRKAVELYCLHISNRPTGLRYSKKCINARLSREERPVKSGRTPSSTASWHCKEAKCAYARETGRVCIYKQILHQHLSEGLATDQESKDRAPPHKTSTCISHSREICRRSISQMLRPRYPRGERNAGHRPW